MKAVTKTRALLSVAFVMALLAGGAVGVVGSRVLPGGDDNASAAPQSPRSRERRSWLTDELNLSPEQEVQMKEIWSPMSRGGPRDHFEKYRAAERTRDDAVVALLTPEQKAQYDRIQTDHQSAIEQLAQERERSFQQAVEATKKILSEEQKKKYEQIMARRPKGDRGDRRGPGGPPPGFGPPPPAPESSTQPSK